MTGRYVVINQEAAFLEADNLLLLPAWTANLAAAWVTVSPTEALQVAKQVAGQACELRLEPLASEAATATRGIPIAVRKQVIALRQQGLSYRKIGQLLNIAKSTVGNVLHRED